jgi:hypothetical protein
MTREEALRMLKYNSNVIHQTIDGRIDSKEVEALDMAIKALQESTEKCTWIKYDYRTMCPKEHDVNSPYWRIPENRMEGLKYCPYCGKEIEVEE